MTDTLDAVRTVLVDALELPQDPGELTPDTALFGALPELDSFGVVALVAAIEERFDITIDDDEFGAELFDTVGSLTRFVEAKLAPAVR
ncbi:acyl carrier protein [Microbacterium sp. zg.B48]|uniref:acyl carrier protein n=1 Tax=unclassified Microbacterium TaxID=2609290 RepID=UPI00214ADFB7|nr:MULTISPECIES: acyl carrier protein [unclassified Microbacterium]MCR2764197.1 acyl carrier protein [Microbacterium sp. zg.B48]MCR2808936.1 acyl carrier protein [Microbacterium sp. zg.B185]WIM18647.1 acyl carrier protein [Microbacterium sp. zg-B185]